MTASGQVVQWQALLSRLDLRAAHSGSMDSQLLVDIALLHAPDGRGGACHYDPLCAGCLTPGGSARYWATCPTVRLLLAAHPDIVRPPDVHKTPDNNRPIQSAPYYPEKSHMEGENSQ